METSMVELEVMATTEVELDVLVNQNCLDMLADVRDSGVVVVRDADSVSITIKTLMIVVTKESICVSSDDGVQYLGDDIFGKNYFVVGENKKISYREKNGILSINVVDQNQKFKFDGFWTREG